MLRIPVDTGVSGPERRKSEILAITDKITKALHEFDTLFLTSQDDEMINDLNSQIECLESGPLKYQLNDFVMRFKEVSAAADQSCTERNEVLESVMQWFNGQQFSDEFEQIGIYDDIDEGSLKLRDELVTTKIGFEKLQKLSEEMVAMKEAGADVTHLERERATLRQSAILNFKSFKRASLYVQETKQQRDIDTKKDEMGKVWKNAAGEICGLLHRVRKDGEEYIEELEKKVKSLASDIEEQSYYFEKMKRQIKEFKLLEQKWKDDNMSLIDQKALTKRKLGKYRKELKNTMEKLSKYERVTVPKFLNEDETEEQKEAAPLKAALEEEARQKALEASPVPLGGMQDPAILRAQLRDCRNQIEQLKGEKEEMQNEMNQLRETLEDLEDDVLRLERDKSELMHQMKQNSIRPDYRRISVSEPRKSSRVFSGSLTIVKLKGVESTDHSDSKKRCCKCGGVKVVTPQSSETHATAPESVTQGSGSDLHTIPSEDKSEKSEGTPSVTVDVKPNQDEQIESLTKKCEELEMKVLELQQKLNETPDQKTRIVYEKAQVDEDFLVPETETAEEVLEVEEVYDVAEEELPAESVPLEKKQTEPAIPSGPDPLFKNVRPRAKGPWEAIVICHKGIQTDPQMDPFGAWSKRGYQTVGHAWKPPAPPSNWMEFDPTAPALPDNSSPGNTEGAALRQAMLGGVQPAEIRQEAMECANLVHRELGRMTQGIQGFMEYTNSLVDRETRILASTNRELRSQLSQHEMQLIDQEMQKIRSSSSLATENDLGFSDPGQKQANPHINMFINHLQQQANSGLNKSLFLESQLPLEERVKNQVEKIGQRSTDILKHAYDIVAGALSEQQREYEQIYQVLNDRQGKMLRKPGATSEQVNRLELEDMEPPAADLKPKRSHSHGDIRKFQGEAARIAVAAARSQSNTDFSRRVTFQNDGKDGSEVEVTGTKSKVANVKEEVHVSKATISKKGQIILSTGSVGRKSSLTLGVGKSFENMAKKVKPAPMSHAKLKKKHDDLIFRGDLQRSEFKATRINQRQLRQKYDTKRKQHGGSKTPPSPSERSMSAKRKGLGGQGKPVLTDYELPSDFFSEYTVAELEQTAMHYANQQKQNFHNEMLDRVHFPNLNKENVLQRQQTPQENQAEKFPKITL